MNLRQISVGMSLFGLPACVTPDAPADADTSSAATDSRAIIGPYVVINEVVALPVDDARDWVEIFNAGTEVASVYRCTDQDELFSIGPGEFEVREPSEDTRGDSLDGSGHYRICGQYGEVLDQIAWANGQSPEGGAFARLPDGIGAFATVGGTTPGATNGTAGRCANGILETSELCDSDTLGTFDCAELGFESGTPTCSADCQRLSASSCVPYFSDVVLNEIAEGDEEFIELATTREQDISGWSVVDRLFETPSRAAVFPPGTTVGPSEFLLVDRTFRIDGAGESIVLRDAEGHVRDFHDHLGCRIPDAGGVWGTGCHDTPGAANER